MTITRLSFPALLLCLLAASGCDDQPEFCSASPGQELTFELDTREEMSLTARIEDVTLFLDPPIEEIILRSTSTGRRIQMLVPATAFPIPVAEQETLGVELRIDGIDPHDSFGIRITDGEGLRYLAVSDWKPGFSAFPWGEVDPGYDLGGGRRVVPDFANGGCDPLEENSIQFRILRNRRASFTIPGEGRIELEPGQTGAIGSWRIHLFKAVEVEPKLPELIQNQLSFFIERENAR